MTTSFTPVDELRELVKASDERFLHNAKVWQLKSERHNHMTEARAILTRGAPDKPLLADERRDYDKHNDAIDLIDTALLNHERHMLEYSKGYEQLMGRGTGSSAAFGDQIRKAVLEVRDGRAMAHVDYPTEHRGLTEAGTGGYGVNTYMAAPVNALAAKSIMMSIPGINHLTATTGDRTRIPRFNAVTVGGTAEAAALTAANSDLDAIDVVYQKFSTYETISTELEEDFSADVLALLGQRMLKDLGIRVDSGLIQGTGAADTVGIFSQNGVSTTSVAGLPADFDKVDEAIYQLELNDGTPGVWIMHPRTWRILSQIKTGIASDKTTLLQPDPQQAAKTLKGLPVYTTSTISIVSGATSVGSTGGVIDPSQIVIITRRAPRLEISRDVKFDTDQIAIRATTRVGLGVLDAAGGISLLTDIRAS